MERVLDEKGFVKNNEYLKLYFPAWQGIVVFRIIDRVNEGYERMNYGPIPVDLGSGTGVIPKATIDASASPPVTPTVTPAFTFPNPLLPPELSSDMWYFTEGNMLFHVYTYIKPYLLRGRLQIPVGTMQNTFHNNLITASYGYEFGYFRGMKEIVYIPRIHIGWIVENKTNMDLTTSVFFEYAEYRVEVIKEPEIVVDVMMGRIPAYTYIFGGPSRFTDDPFRLSWKVEPVKVFPIDKKKEALDYAASVLGGGGK